MAKVTKKSKAKGSAAGGRVKDKSKVKAQAKTNTKTKTVSKSKDKKIANQKKKATTKTNPIKKNKLVKSKTSPNKTAKKTVSQAKPKTPKGMKDKQKVSNNTNVKMKGKSTPVIKKAIEKKNKPKLINKPVEVKNVVNNPPIAQQPVQAHKSEPYMDREKLLYFKNMLENWKKEIMEEVDNTIMEMKEASVIMADPNDCATQEETFSLELRARDRERKVLKKIEEALKRIDMEEYGYCEECGIEIGIKRLEARPTATLCIDCKTLNEIKEKRA